MCDTCLIESVKQSMLSRRALFTGAAATTAAVMASGLTTARPALAQAAGRAESHGSSAMQGCWAGIVICY